MLLHIVQLTTHFTLAFDMSSKSVKANWNGLAPQRLLGSVAKGTISRCISQMDKVLWLIYEILQQVGQLEKCFQWYVYHIVSTGA